MDVYFKTFQEALDQNNIDEERWISFKNELSQTRETINTFLKSCKLEIMVPLGKKAFVRGQLQHTNDILMSHNSNYFSLVSNAQANEIMDLRTNACNERLKSIKKERDLFQGKLDVSTNNIFSENEIIEEYNEEDEKKWREKHRESIRRLKLQEAEERKNENMQQNINDLLDQYELLEEMTNELESLENYNGTDTSEMIKKLMSKDTKITESKKRVSHHNLNNEKKSLKDKSIEIKLSEKMKEKRKVRFSSSLEDIKIFDSSQSAVKIKNHTIPITFKHSSVKFVEPSINDESDKDILYWHPGEIYSKYKEQFSSKAKSILKETCYDPNMNVKSIQEQQYEETIEKELAIPLSSFPLVCTDEVIERNAKDNKSSELKNFEVNSVRRMSKFKEMRSKIKS